MWYPARRRALSVFTPRSATRGVSVLGTTPGVIALLQATEEIKSLTGTGVVLENEMLIYDGETMSFDRVRVLRNPQCKSCTTLGVVPSKCPDM